MNIRIEIDEMWGRVKSKKKFSFRGHTIDHDNRNVITYVIGSREQDILCQSGDILYNSNLYSSFPYADNNVVHPVCSQSGVHKPD